jgi:hypothetical protein
MAIPNSKSSFICYDLTESEEEIGQILNFEQTLRIQNEIAVYAEEKVMVRVPPNSSDYFGYALTIASLDAKIELLKWLLETSELATQAAKERASRES